MADRGRGTAWTPSLLQVTFLVQHAPQGSLWDQAVAEPTLEHLQSSAETDLHSPQKRSRMKVHIVLCLHSQRRALSASSGFPIKPSGEEAEPELLNCYESTRDLFAELLPLMSTVWQNSQFSPFSTVKRGWSGWWVTMVSLSLFLPPTHLFFFPFQPTSASHLLSACFIAADTK